MINVYHETYVYSSSSSYHYYYDYDDYCHYHTWRAPGDRGGGATVGYRRPLAEPLRYHHRYSYYVCSYC